MQNEIEIVGTPEDNNPFKKKKKKQRPFRVTDAIRKKKRKKEK